MNAALAAMARPALPRAQPNSVALARALATKAQDKPRSRQYKSVNAQGKGPRSPRTPRDKSTATPPRSLQQLLHTFTTLKQQERTPTPAAYLALIRAAGDYANRRGNNLGRGELATEGHMSLGLDIALAAMRDAEAGKIELGTEALDQLFRFTFIHPDIIPSLLVEVLDKHIASPSAYNTLASNAAAGRRVDEMIVVVVEMLEQGMVPPKHVVKHLVRLCCEFAMPRLAMQVVERVERMPGAAKSEAAVWVNILSSSAENQYLEGVEAAWNRIVTNKAYTPDEGLLLNVLAVAGRWGRPDLAVEALDILPELNVVAGEHHLAPLIDAYCRAGRVPEAFEVVSSLRAAGLTPTLDTVRSLIKVLSTPELVDQAFYALEDAHADGKAVDIVSLNALIAASARGGDLQRARATQLAIADLGAEPTLETFNLVLDACARAKHRELGDTILSELSTAGYTPDGKTYGTMVHLSLTQEAYEDAFYYLEKMKAEGFTPTADIYDALARKCAKAGDERWKLVATEMHALGYRARDYGAAVEEAKMGERRRGGRGDRERGSRGASGRRDREEGGNYGTRRREGRSESATARE